MGRIYFVWCGAKFEVAIVFAVTGGCESSRWGRNIIRVNVNVEYSDFFIWKILYLKMLLNFLFITEKALSQRKYH